METRFSATRAWEIVLATLPVAFAIAVFGVIFGAAARPLLGPERTVASSLLIFSGAVQFAAVGALHSAAPPATILLTTVILNLRNVLLGAVLRPRLIHPWPKRALLSWFLVDETVGLALALRGEAAATLLVAGLLCYLAWIVGTLLGVIGASALQFRSVAEAIFPVLFIGLAAISARGREGAVRAVLAAILTIVLARILPAWRGIAPVVAAVAVALPVKRR